MIRLYKILTGLLLILISIIDFFVYSLNVFGKPLLLIFGFFLVVWGFAGVVIAYNKDEKLLLFISTSIAFLGFILVTLGSFNLKNYSQMLFPALMTGAGSGLFSLFIKNNKDYLSGIAGFIFVLCGILLASLYKSTTMFIILDNISYEYYSNWSLLLLLLGITLLVNKSNFRKEDQFNLPSK